MEVLVVKWKGLGKQENRADASGTRRFGFPFSAEMLSDGTANLGEDARHVGRQSPVLASPDTTLGIWSRFANDAMGNIL